MAAKKSAKKAVKRTAKKKTAIKKPATKKVATKKVATKKAATKKKKVAKKTVSKKAVATAVEEKPKATAKKPKKKRKSAKEKKPHYVNGKEFYEQIKEYYRTGDLPDILAESVHKIAVGLSYAPNFINYSYKDEMVGDAVLKMFLALKNKKYNVDTHNNPFSYFTTIAFHAFINRIKKEKKHRETITKYQETYYSDLMETNGDDGNNVYIDPTQPGELDE